MAEQTGIEWCDATFNPWIGCTRVSPACDDCYAARSTPARSMRIEWGPGQPRRRTSDANWREPVKWNARAERGGRRLRVFCASLADVFDNEVPDQWRADLFRLIANTPQLDWLLLTKRIGNARDMIFEARKAALPRFEMYGPPALPNVWVGATVVNQEEANRDIPKLLAVPAAVRFLSIEPMLGPVDLSTHRGAKGLPLVFEGTEADGQMPVSCGATGRRLNDRPRRGWVKTSENMSRWVDWVIAGGESGPRARPMNPDWARSLRDQCAAAGVPFLFKQWGEYLPANANEDDPTLPDVPESRLFWSDGTKWERQDGQRGGVDMVARVGKRAAGALLDGKEHKQWPR